MCQMVTDRQGFSFCERAPHEYPEPVDGFDIADAMLAGWAIPSAKLRSVIRYGDSADALYVRLFETVGKFAEWHTLEAGLAPMRPRGLENGWLNIFRYANRPNAANLRRLMYAITVHDMNAGIVMRLSRIVLTGQHRRTFARYLEYSAADNPFLSEESGEVVADLKECPGPARLFVRRNRGRPLVIG